MIFSRFFLAFFLVFTLTIACTGDQRTLKMEQSTRVALSPIFADPDVYPGDVGSAASVAISDCSDATESSFQHLVITNRHTTQNLCWYFVAPYTGTDGGTVENCGSTRTCDGTSTDGNMVLPDRSWPLTAACDLHLCLIASASSTTYHVTRYEF